MAATGHRVVYVQDIHSHDAESPRWSGIGHTDRVAGVTVPVSSIGGWYDIFLPRQLRDFRILQDAGARRGSPTARGRTSPGTR